ncbi:hypothetical protein E0485_18760 [Paenibacillus albiflavus]|uniref:Uncharacterized protein n=1 Tax=Paenibacillus albiflavus TaxID=2545760 RepID=A0A4R4E7T2_9BACL|nr:hypothetical protein [Paenibacillus albiflavus]TCZ75187.1 hypothetical protein E0485_18760 [Paenibacillus albiflavus]
MIIIKNPKHGNVVLMPQTIEHYESELTSLLSNERYDEAVDILRYLMGFSDVDSERRMEWEQLLAWLYMMYPELQQTSQLGIEDDARAEAELRKQLLGDKWSAESASVLELLHTMEHPSSVDKQLITLDKLAHVGGNQVIHGIRKWLVSREMHPLLQFKALQALKLAGDFEYISIIRSGSEILVNPSDCPLDSSEIPAGIEHIFQTIDHVCEVAEPMIGEFASQMQWDVIATSYGTSLYKAMSNVLNEQEAAVWASALHALLASHIYGGTQVEQIRELYEIVSYPIEEWMDVYQKCRVFL